MSSIISVRGLAKQHGEGDGATTVLADVELELGQGEFLCVMGPSGSGKSTLLHLLSGLDTPTSGQVQLVGDDVSALKPRELTLKRRATIGHVFQFFNLMPNLTCEENVGLPLAIAGDDPEVGEHRERINGLLERFGLTHRRAALPHEMSGGEMQRTSIARALAGEQPVLLCDEPTGNLSQKAGLEVMETLRRICDDDGRSILLVTHNPRDATFADRVLFLVDGKLADSVLTGPGLSVEQVHATLAALHI